MTRKKTDRGTTTDSDNVTDQALFSFIHPPRCSRCCFAPPTTTPDMSDAEDMSDGGSEHSSQGGTPMDADSGSDAGDNDEYAYNDDSTDDDEDKAAGGTKMAVTTPQSSASSAQQQFTGQSSGTKAFRSKFPHAKQWIDLVVGWEEKVSFHLASCTEEVRKRDATRRAAARSLPLQDPK